MSAWEIILNILLLGLGFLLLVKGADWFVDGAAAIAEKLGIPQIVIGLTIVAFGTSLPEASVSITAAISGSADIAIGNVVGSNIANILLILGLCGLLGKLSVQKNTLFIEIPFVILIGAVLLLLGIFDNNLNRWDGAILLALFVVFCVYLVIISKKQMKLAPTETKEEGTVTRKKSTWLVLLLLAMGMVAIILGAKFAVDSAKKLAIAAGLSEKFIGLTIIALGTSLPELVTSVIATRKGKNDLAIGNIVGSVIFNILFILGVTALIQPIPFGANYIVDNLVEIASAIVLFCVISFTKDKKIKALGGGMMLTSYVAYMVYLLVKDLA